MYVLNLSSSHSETDKLRSGSNEPTLSHSLIKPDLKLYKLKTQMQINPTANWVTMAMG